MCPRTAPWNRTYTKREDKALRIPEWEVSFTPKTPSLHIQMYHMMGGP
jgi:hypothetical protein